MSSLAGSIFSPTWVLVECIGLVLIAALFFAWTREWRRTGRLRAIAESRSAELVHAAREQTAILDASLLAIVVLDPDKRVVVWNPAAERMSGYMTHEVLGNPYPLVPETGRAEFESLFARIAAGEVVRDMEVRRKRKDGAVFDVAFSGVSLRDRDGHFRGGLFTLDDVTERRALHQQLVQAQKMEAIGQLTGGIAHDFNNLLGAVIGNLDLALEEVDERARARPMLNDALDAALRGAELVKRLLAVARTQPLALQTVDIAQTVGRMLPLLRSSLGEPVKIETVFTDDLWIARADPVQLESALLNLAINARDAMPDGGTLTFEANNFVLESWFQPVYSDLKIGEYVVLSVTDSGAGMPPEVAARVLEPFFTTKEAGKGTGLGLSMVYGYMKQSGGGVKIYSEVGVGTRIALYFPRGDAGAGKDTAQAAAAEEERGGNERVLIVEDNPEVRKVAIGVLQNLGYDVHATADAAEALAALETNPFDLVFSDVVMPRMNGITLAQEIRRLYPNTAVLLTSGFSSKLGAGVELDRIGVGFVPKPYRKAQLAAALRIALAAAAGRNGRF
jgi:PAS domain S-box-containing protein